MLTGCSWGRSRDAHGVTPTGFQNGSKMGAKSGPRETMKTVLPSGRELRVSLGCHWGVTGVSLGRVFGPG